MLFPKAEPILERQMQRKLLIQCQAELANDAGSERERQQLEEVEEVMRQLLAPKNLHPRNSHNVALNFERNLESSCMELEQRGVVNPSELTLYQFYSRIQHFQKQEKKGK